MMKLTRKGFIGSLLALPAALKAFALGAEEPAFKSFAHGAAEPDINRAGDSFKLAEPPTFVDISCDVQHFSAGLHWMEPVQSRADLVNVPKIDGAAVFILEDDSGWVYRADDKEWYQFAEPRRVVNAGFTQLS